MTKLYLIRHAEAEGNLYRRVHGHYDSMVTDLGLRQIAALQLRFSAVPINAVYSSDLTRAHATARALSAARGLPVRLTPRLREVYMGRWEDLTWARLEREEPEQLHYFSRDPARWDIGSNETFAAQTERIVSAVSHIAANHPQETVAIVAHGNVIRSLLAHILDLPSARFGEAPHCDNTGVSLIEAENGAMRIQFMNDNSHLSPEISTFARQSWWREKGETDKGNLDFLPLDLTKSADIARYLAYRQAAWLECYGDLEGFCEKETLSRARGRAATQPRALMEALWGDTGAGLLELDTEEGKERKNGEIACLYLPPKLRGRGLGVQFIGHAVSVYRPLERERLTLWAAVENQNAIAFYERFGFLKAAEKAGPRGTTWLMEKDIRVRLPD